MAQDQPLVPEERSNVVPLVRAQRRKRVVAAIESSLKLWPAIETAEARKQMIELGVNKSQIIHGMHRAEVLEFAEDGIKARLTFTAKLLSAGEEFFVSASVERVVPYAGTHVIINRVWR